MKKHQLVHLYLGILLAVCGMHSTAMAGSNGYELTGAKFVFDTVINPKTGNAIRVSPEQARQGNPPFFGNNGFVGASIERDRVLKGTIVIDEYNRSELINRTIRVPVFFGIRATGGTLGLKATWNSSMAIYGLEGKTLAQLLETEFTGYKGSLGIGFILGFNPNIMYLNNDYGITIIDSESWLAVTGAGGQVVSISAEFKTEMTTNYIIEVQSAQGSATKTTSSDPESVINYQF